MKNVLCSLVLLLFVYQLFAQRGKDGNLTISSTNTIVNEYTYLTASVSSGSTSITVASSSLNANGRFTSSLAAGDLIFIIQVQGVHVKGWKNTDVWQHARPMDETYGRILDYESCGYNEFVQVTSVPNGTTINLNCPLTNDYITEGDTTEVVVVRVPRYNNLTVNGSASITCEAWNGQTGGIVAIEVLNDATINGNIDVSELGFRGGEALLSSSFWNVSQFGSPSNDDGAEKGEGIYGFRSEYNTTKSGYYCKGSIANAGGGGNGNNCGGGGGSNAGDTSAWTGQGNPSLDVANWANAWNLESPGFATSTSSGGGRGGYSYSGTDQNALTTAPGNTAWGGDNRKNNGGWGGRPLDYSNGRLFFGGGGGAGDQNDNDGGDGGNGGGLIYLLVYGDVNGSGNLLADGETGGNATGPSPGFGEKSGIDGAGGGGAGGTIVINAVGTISGVSASADGGDGGDQNLQFGMFSGDTDIAEGPGGGGSGGYIAVSNGAITTSASGGQYGVTNSNSLPEFTPNGSTSGGDGIGDASINSFEISVVDTLYVCSSDTAHLSAIITASLPSGTSIVWYDAELGGSLLYTGQNYDIPASSIVSGTTYYVGTCPGTYRVPVVVELVNVSATASADVDICEGDSTTLSVVGAGSILWSTGATSSSITVSPGATTTYTVAISASGCTATDEVVVTFNALPTVTANASSTSLCDGDPLTLSGSGTASSYVWDNSVTNGVSFVPTASTMYHVTGTDGTCSNTDSIYVTVDPLPTVQANATDTILCLGDNVTLTGLGTASSYAWDNGVTNGVAFAPLTPTTYTVTGTLGGCTDIDSIFVNVVATPTAFAGNDTSLCVGDTIQLTATGGGTYLWSNSLTTQTISVNPTANTTYTVTVSVGSCTATDDVIVTAITPPTAQAGADETICFGDSFTLTASGGGTYMWSSGDNTASTVVSPALTTTYYVTVSNGTCDDIDSALVTVLSNADATITPAGPYCENDLPITLTAVDAGGTWSGTAVNAVTGVFDPNAAGIGTHQIIYTIAGQCGDADTIDIDVLANADATITNPGNICISGGTVTLTAAQAGGIWSGTAVNAATGVFDPATAGTGQHQIIYTIAGQCGDADTISVNVITQQDASITAVSPLCENDVAIQLVAVDGGGVWTGNGVNASGLFDPSVASAGIHQINYSISGACGDSDSISIEVYDVPDVQDSIIHESCIGANDGEIYIQIIGGTSPYSINWSNGGVQDSVSGLAPGTYSVTVSDQHLCEETFNFIINGSMDDCFNNHVYIPNIFSPNGDGNNDVLDVNGGGIQNFEMKIYDRWGVKVFESKTIDIDWDGTYRNGEKAEVAVYTYYAKGTYTNGDEFTLKGNITLVR